MNSLYDNVCPGMKKGIYQVLFEVFTSFHSHVHIQATAMFYGAIKLCSGSQSIYVLLLNHCCQYAYPIQVKCRFKIVLHYMNNADMVKLHTTPRCIQSRTMYEYVPGKE